MKTNRQTGFTLIEVLIAATILFAVIGVVSQTYRSAIISSEKATRSVALLGITPLLLDTIQFRLKQADVDKVITDEGVIDGFQFDWTAKVIKAASPPARFSPEEGEVVTFDNKFFLWKVVLTIKQEDYSQTFEFENLAWGTQ
ncbi:prepilin-type N-terminal cleavage/methylation domain-containing protein [Shewanella sp. SW36]|uniref:prepilin-type N-terminal cleavage/methylation domain-containing protein n=1 Tax=unclassified Shewanella TaxID=196818 RepID=UPI0021DA57FD|nr:MULTISPECIES: prepilin-type N-terminal cleavage/methylation domain-containing protein [unclassified Shewanella]MCU7975903.1 prepilin-type N-terminal cleavage/methylation domain-containing protein [Shewanella sp. SW36]MCU7991293.1 prepilin-type N-terminal cleavage/methylation domain-containing protein [Shewanella sp. SW1]MCU8052530.1 prepilin-type N-terminal cleavage/methylation domain-containing protein [Shewanella sp. SM43]